MPDASPGLAPLSTLALARATGNGREHVLPSVKIDIRNLDFTHDKTKKQRRLSHNADRRTLKGISLPIYEKSVLAVMGPSGSGKSTLLRTVNRMYDTEQRKKHVVTGEILMGGENLLDPHIDLNALRSRVGMVFQDHAVFPMTIYQNIAFGIRLDEKLSRAEMDAKVEAALTKAALWAEVRDRLNDSPNELSGGQKQRLCIARTIAVEPEVILMDEPTSKLDRRSVMKIEQLIDQLRRDYTLVIVTHDPQQAARVADYTAVLIDGEVAEFGIATQMFVSPKNPRVEDFLTGRLGDDDDEESMPRTPSRQSRLPQPLAALRNRFWPRVDAG